MISRKSYATVDEHGRVQKRYKSDQVQSTINFFDVINKTH